jgi:hypothetical protein
MLLDRKLRPKHHNKWNRKILLGNPANILVEKDRQGKREEPCGYGMFRIFSIPDPHQRILVL